MGVSISFKKQIDDRVAQIKIHPELPLLFVGTYTGDLLIFNLEHGEIIHREGFYVLNEYNELKKINSPIRSIAFSDNFDLVYTFTDAGAICINIRNMEKIAEIPLEDPLIHGDVSPTTGDIAILTEDGYLSRWTPKFHSRSGYFELSRRNAIKKIRMVDGKTVIGLGKNNELFLLDFETHKVSKLKEYEKTPYLFVENWIQSNNHFFVHLSSSGNILFGRVSKPRLSYFRDHEGEPIKNVGIRTVPAEELHSTYEFMKNHFETLGLYEEEFHEDVRLKRNSKDKYDATVDNITDFKKLRNSLREEWDPDRILHFAIKEYIEGSEKGKPLRVLLVLCNEYNLDPQLAIFSWKMNGKRMKNLIPLTRRLMNEAELRKAKIRRITVSAIIIALASLKELIYPSQEPLNLLITGIVVTLAILFFRIGNRVNRVPKIPSLETFFLLRVFVLLITIISALLGIARYLDVSTIGFHP